MKVEELKTLPTDMKLFQVGIQVANLLDLAFTSLNFIYTPDFILHEANGIYVWFVQSFGSMGLLYMGFLKVIGGIVISAFFIKEYLKRKQSNDLEAMKGIKYISILFIMIFLIFGAIPNILVLQG